MYYFTFGSAGQLFRGGWVRIKAETLREAREKFIAKYGDRAFKDNPPFLARALNYSFGYNEEEFNKTEMREHGNWGNWEHDYIE